MSTEQSAVGQLFLVSVGPGFAELVPEKARQALSNSDVIVGYDLYMRWVGPWIQKKQIETFPLTQERRRAERALELARQGKRVSLVSSGDIGVYAMATLAFELLEEADSFPVEVIPGISAANACAALLGAPLSHDFATLSLSDLLCPWNWIEERARHIARADLAAVLYNVQSKSRQEGVYQILEIFAEHKSPETWCGVVRNAYREEQSVQLFPLNELRAQRFDMLTSIVIGNRFTQRKQHFLFTPRGYQGWDPLPQRDLPHHAVWVFSGTSDGNEIARRLQAEGDAVVVSTATDLGATQAELRALPVVSGRLGKEQRAALLQQHSARVIVDATHPFAAQISRQLLELSAQLKIPYIRYERPSALTEASLRHIEVICEAVDVAAQAAMQRGNRIFLATGSQSAKRFVQCDADQKHEWFVRCAPSVESLRALEQSGVPVKNVCAQQGPFSVEQNLALWRQWAIEVVVTKDSGAAGGFVEKLDAAKELRLPVIVLRRPPIKYPRHLADISQLCAWVKEGRYE
jgi:precorrin-3B C17-methyltransferase